MQQPNSQQAAPFGRHPERRSKMQIPKTNGALTGDPSRFKDGRLNNPELKRRQENIGDIGLHAMLTSEDKSETSERQGSNDR